MKRLIDALSELLEAKAELLKEEAATLGLGTYARAYKEGQQDLMNCDCGCMADIDADDSPDCG
jgi:hypothetical protein